MTQKPTAGVARAVHWPPPQVQSPIMCPHALQGDTGLPRSGSRLCVHMYCSAPGLPRLESRLCVCTHFKMITAQVVQHLDITRLAGSEGNAPRPALLQCDVDFRLG